jgi:SpoVK/Ycf46/Vps4 family AAA+-type ATPase
MDPKRLKKDLVKVLKSVKPEDRVLVVGTSRRPFDADLKPFCKVYRKIILIPRPDYASRLGGLSIVVYIGLYWFIVVYSGLHWFMVVYIGL